MASLGFDETTVRQILDNIDNIRDDDKINEGDYLKMCNALKYLHACVAPQELPPPPPIRPPEWGQMMQSIGIQPVYIGIPLTLDERRLNYLRNELQWVRSTGGRLSLQDKITVCELLFDQNPDLTRPPSDISQYLYVGRCMEIIFEITPAQLRHEFYAQKDRRIRANIARLEREISELESSIVTELM